MEIVLSNEILPIDLCRFKVKEILDHAVIKRLIMVITLEYFFYVVKSNHGCLKINLRYTTYLIIRITSIILFKLLLETPKENLMKYFLPNTLPGTTTKLYLFSK